MFFLFVLTGRLGELDRPRHVRLAGDDPLLLEGLEMAHHPVGRVDLEVLADLTDRRAVAAAAHLVANEFVDLALPGGELFHGHASSPGKSEW